MKKSQENNNINVKKPTLLAIIAHAIKFLPEEQGTKQEIIDKIINLYGNIKLKSWRVSAKQILSKCFVKNPGVYRLLPETIIPEYKKCNVMKDYIAWVLAKYGPLSRNVLKDKIQEHFEQFLNISKSQGNLMTWEISFLKILKTCKFIDSRSAKTTFKIS